MSLRSKTCAAARLLGSLRLLAPHTGRYRVDYTLYDGYYREDIEPIEVGLVKYNT